MLVEKGLAETRAKAQALIMAGRVNVDGMPATKAGHLVSGDLEIRIDQGPKYVSRGGLKMASVAKKLAIDFNGKTVLDVGSSTGGFTDYALQNSAAKVYAVDVGTNQLDQKLRNDSRVVVLEKTDIRKVELPEKADLALIDVSFISLTKILIPVSRLLTRDGLIVAMAKPQFEASKQIADRYSGVIKDETVRQQILDDLETWLREHYEIIGSADSEVTGAQGNRERFYLLDAKT